MNRALSGLACVLMVAACKPQPSPTGGQSSAALGASQGAREQTAKAAPKKYDGPFGLQGGLSLEEVKQSTTLTADPDSSAWFSTTTVPTPHPAFESYQLGFSEKSGLCALVAIGKDIKTGDSGFEVRSAFDDLSTALSDRYGKGKKYDFYTGAGSDDAQYWMMNLLEKDRTLAMAWDKDSGASLPSNISSVSLQAGATRMNVGYLTVRYEFANFQDCVAEDKKAKNKAL